MRTRKEECEETKGRLLEARTVENASVKHRLTNFPQLHPQIPVRIEPPGKLPTLIQYAHEPQQVFSRDGVVDIVILQEFMCRLNEKQLQDTFDDDLLEEAALVGVCQRGR